MTTPDGWENDPAIAGQIAYELDNQDESFGRVLFTYGDMQESLATIGQHHPLEPFATMVMFHHLAQIVAHKPEYFAELSATGLLDLQSTMTKMILKFMVESMDIQFRGKED